MDEYLGIIKAFGGNFAPRGYALCNGQLLSVTQNTALFAVIGTAFGGNGQSTFGLPNLQGRAPIGTGQLQGGGNYPIGQSGGTENVTLTTGNIPAHTHIATSTLFAEGDDGTLATPAGNMFGALANLYAAESSSGNQSLSSQSVVTTNSSVGNSLPFNNLSPYQAVTYIICTEGLFPSRN